MFLIFTRDIEYNVNLCVANTRQEAEAFLAEWKDTPEARERLWNQEEVVVQWLPTLQPGSPVTQPGEQEVILVAEEDEADEEGPGYRWEWASSLGRSLPGSE